MRNTKKARRREKNLSRTPLTRSKNLVYKNDKHRQFIYIYIWLYSLITILFLVDTSSIELRFHFLLHSLGSDGDTNFPFFCRLMGAESEHHHFPRMSFLLLLLLARHRFFFLFTSTNVRAGWVLTWEICQNRKTYIVSNSPFFWWW